MGGLTSTGIWFWSTSRLASHQIARGGCKIFDMQTPLAEASTCDRCSYASLGEQCLAEALACNQTPAARTYVTALLRLAAGLDFRDASEEEVTRLIALTGEYDHQLAPWEAGLPILVFVSFDF